MKFLVLSDIHGRDKVAAWANRLAKDNAVDAIIILGDITHFGPGSWAGEFLAKLERPIYAIAGNCDPPEWVNKEIETHATLLHRRKEVVEGYTFIGLGGSNPTIFETPFEMEEEEIESYLRPLMEKDAILVVHAPPRGFNDTIPNGMHVGSEAILKLVQEFRPLVVLSGHIHEARGIVQKDGTLFMNPGPARDGYSALLEIDGEIKGTLLDRAAD